MTLLERHQKYLQDEIDRKIEEKAEANRETVDQMRRALTNPRLETVVTKQLIRTGTCSVIGLGHVCYADCPCRINYLGYLDEEILAWENQGLRISFYALGFSITIVGTEPHKVKEESIHYRSFARHEL